ncbi:MAG: hypothetical protein GY816_02225 [Cytophagales bacterium]|nr:hypothetical protein [Cytophagales bacterium]
MDELFKITTEPAPSLTDWIAAGSAFIGIPLIVGSFIKLLLRDRDKQKRLTAIESLAINQNVQLLAMQEQVEQLSQHTSEFRNQTFLMRESNEILNKQLEIQINAHETSENIEKRKLELDNKKHLISIRPYFNHGGRNSNANEFNLTLKNTGAEAHDVILITEEESNIIFSSVKTKKVKTYGAITINGKSKKKISSVPSNLMIFTAQLEFSDNEGNRYIQSISRLANRSFEIETPVAKKIDNKV